MSDPLRPDDESGSTAPSEEPVGTIETTDPFEAPPSPEADAPMSDAAAEPTSAAEPVPPAEFESPSFEPAATSYEPAPPAEPSTPVDAGPPAEAPLAGAATWQTVPETPAAAPFEPPAGTAYQPPPETTYQAPPDPTYQAPVETAYQPPPEAAAAFAAPAAAPQDPVPTDTTYQPAYPPPPAQPPDPAYQQPAYYPTDATQPQPGYQQPTYQQPGYQAPYQQAPYQQPGYQQPGYPPGFQQYPAAYPPGYPQQWAAPAEYRYGNNIVVILGALWLLIAGLVLTVSGLPLLIGGRLLEQLGVDELANAIGNTLTIVAVALFVIVLHLLAAIFIWAHRSWARWLGVLLAFVGMLAAAGLLFVSFSRFTLSDGTTIGPPAGAAADPGSMAVNAIPFVLYLITLLALLFGGGHFLRRRVA